MLLLLPCCCCCRFDRSPEELREYCDWLVSEGQLLINSQGWYAYPGNSRAANSPSALRAAAAATAASTPSHSPSPSTAPTAPASAPVLAASPAAPAAFPNETRSLRAPSPAALRIAADPPAVSPAPSSLFTSAPADDTATPPLQRPQSPPPSRSVGAGERRAASPTRARAGTAAGWGAAAMVGLAALAYRLLIHDDGSAAVDSLKAVPTNMAEVLRRWVCSCISFDIAFRYILYYFLLLTTLLISRCI
ncbi:hypothetical protein V8C86DRAFT_1394448 [Haematococcus lacustris]